MGYEQILPITGVVVGWFLSALSTGWKTRGDRKRIIGGTIVKLFQLHTQVSSMESTLNSFKPIKNPKEYEEFRKYISDRHFLSESLEIKEIIKAAENLGEFLPIEAIDVYTVIDTASRIKSTSLLSSSQFPDVYTRILSLHETGILLMKRILRTCILRLALRHSIFTLVQALFKLRRGDRSRSTNESFLEKFATETMAALPDK